MDSSILGTDEMFCCHLRCERSPRPNEWEKDIFLLAWNQQMTRGSGETHGGVPTRSLTSMAGPLGENPDKKVKLLVGYM